MYGLKKNVRVGFVGVVRIFGCSYWWGKSLETALARALQ